MGHGTELQFTNPNIKWGRFEEGLVKTTHNKRKQTEKGEMKCSDGCGAKRTKNYETRYKCRIYRQRNFIRVSMKVIMP